MASELISEADVSAHHLLHALAIGIAAGIALVFIDQFLLSKLETAIGLPAMAA